MGPVLENGVIKSIGMVGLMEMKACCDMYLVLPWLMQRVPGGLLKQKIPAML